jgi:hypothetical protein
MDMLKRLLNVVTIVFVLFLSTTIFFYILGLVENINFNYLKFGVCFLFGVGILVFNFIVFKKITLWHN